METQTETRNGGIVAAQSVAETLEQWHRLAEWAGETYPEPKELSREDRAYLMRETDWREHTDPETLREWLEEMVREYPLSVEYRCGAWQLSPESCEPDEFRILITTGGPAVAVFGDLSCSGYASDPELKGQDWFTQWEPVDCDSDALQWFCDQLIFG